MFLSNRAYHPGFVPQISLCFRFDFLPGQTDMDSLLKNITGAKDQAEEKQNQPSGTSDLLSSAKVVAGAAQATLRHESDKVDKAQVAGAGADLLDAGSRYAKLDEKTGVGAYVEKAENYLHQYHSSHSNATAPAAASSDHPAAETPTADAKSGGDEKSGGGYGDYLKMAEGYLKNN